MFAAMAVISGGLIYLFLHVDLIPYPGSAERVLIDDFVQVLFAVAGFFFGVIPTVFVYAMILDRMIPTI